MTRTNSERLANGRPQVTASNTPSRRTTPAKKPPAIAPSRRTSRDQIHAKVKSGRIRTPSLNRTAQPAETRKPARIPQGMDRRLAAARRGAATKNAVEIGRGYGVPPYAHGSQWTA